MAGADAATEPFTPEQLAFCRALPKVELHAHLNGCIRDSTIRCGQPAHPLRFPAPCMAAGQPGMRGTCLRRPRQLPQSTRRLLTAVPAVCRRELSELLGGQAVLSQAELLALTQAASRTLGE